MPISDWYETTNGKQVYDSRQGVWMGGYFIKNDGKNKNIMKHTFFLIIFFLFLNTCFAQQKKWTPGEANTLV
jgi:hypothetical protein